MPTEFDTEILESTTAVYNAVILDENDVPIDLVDLASITLTFYDVATGAIINTRSDQDVLNVNNVVIATTGGGLAWTMLPIDNAIQDTEKFKERHRALFEFVYNVTKQGRHEVDFIVRNLGKVP